jgi:hypothetical protein
MLEDVILSVKLYRSLIFLINLINLMKYSRITFFYQILYTYSFLDIWTNHFLYEFDEIAFLVYFKLLINRFRDCFNALTLSMRMIVQ